MDSTRTILIIAGCFLIFCWSGTNGQLEQNATELMKDESLLPVRERVRRLIPYMTYYLGQGYNNQNQYVTATPQQYQDIQQTGHDMPTQSYQVPQPYHQQNYQLVPVGYLVGGGYRRVPVYSRPQLDYSAANPFTAQRPSDFTRMISQNYAPQKQPKDQRPTQYINKPQYTSHPQTPLYKISTNKNYIQQELSPQQSIQRLPFYQKPARPSYTPLKDDSYVELHSNYDANYNTRQNTKSYEPELNGMTITKSQEIKVPTEINPTLIEAPIPTASPKPIINYEPSAPAIENNGLLDLLAGYQLSKALPERVTSSNIGYSIETLSHILRILQKAKAQSSASPQDFEGDGYDNGLKENFSPYQTEGSTPGRAGIDYPAYSVIPETRFSCKNQRYKGFFGDPETNCQVWHYCDLNGGQASFLCPNGTIFSQVALTCDWWFNVKCASTAQLYVLNERLYKYILPAKPSFPEDYAGPLVDEYLTLKFQELEAKKKNTTTTEKTPSTIEVLLNDEINQAVK